MDALTAAVPRDQIATEIDLILGGVKGDPNFHESLARLPWCSVVSLTWDSFAKQIFTQRRWSQNGEWQTFTPDAHESPHFFGTRKGLNFRLWARLNRESAGWRIDARAEGAI